MKWKANKKLRINRNASIKDAIMDEIKSSGSKLVIFKLVIRIRRVIIKNLHSLLVTISAKLTFITSDYLSPELNAHQYHYAVDFSQQIVALLGDKQYHKCYNKLSWSLVCFSLSIARSTQRS
jgi:hypothetical protein